MREEPRSVARKTAYVANYGSGTVPPIDIATNTPGPPVTVRGNPADVAIEGGSPAAQTPEVATVMMLPTAGALVLAGWFFVTRRRRSNESVEVP